VDKCWNSIPWAKKKRTRTAVPRVGELRTEKEEEDEEEAGQCARVLLQ